VPLIAGFSPSSIADNIATEVRAGKPVAQAVAIAYENARKAWHEAHPRKPLPARLRRRRSR
jgi:hypothetical protein